MMKKIVYITMFCVLLLFNCNVMAEDITGNRVVDQYKNWTIHFNDEIDFDKILFNDIYVLDSEGFRVYVDIIVGDDNKSIIVCSPSEGYQAGEKYTLTINDTMHSKKNVYLKHSVEMEFSIASIDINDDKIMDKLVVLPETDYDESEAKQMINRLSKIDHRILEELSNANVKIKLTNTNVTDVDEYIYLKGVTPRGWENTGKTWDDIPGLGGNLVVARIGYSEPSYKNGHGAINLELHETAHAIDYYVFDKISGLNEFISIMNVEGEKLFPNDGYRGGYCEEYFAEAFAMYYLNDKTNEELKEKAPLTYKFMGELPEKISQKNHLEESA
ncbi:anthrax toxin lethal factor-related metalloendopeptidase [Oceanirhabdus seepicola]|uniref:ATLF-like domain-containing protein n=1 Tax=Oceanirhabdus seepicola TaxID=2828781 RepID=A0A9J6P0G7_9CLOT|nr:hypothetical protein [Oceanirhabdus seepicola]MCM1988928.1 hypothetical protein [Oceanirhabdus seepicola]